jgi:hypothetical protein
MQRELVNLMQNIERLVKWCKEYFMLEHDIPLFMILIMNEIL